MPSLKVRMTARQWKTLVSMASARRTSPEKLVKQRVFEEKGWRRGLEISESVLVNTEEFAVYPVEKSGTMPNGNIDTLISATPALNVRLLDVDAPAIPEEEPCSFCGGTGRTWWNGTEGACPKCGMRVEVTE